MLLGCKSSLSRCFWSPSGFCLLLCDLKTTLYCYIRLYPIYAVILRMVFDCSIRNLFSWALAPLPGYLLDIINKGRSQYALIYHNIAFQGQFVSWCRSPRCHTPSNACWISQKTTTSSSFLSIASNVKLITL